MSGTFPSNPSFVSVNFKINTPLLKSESFSGITRRVAMGHQFYTFTVKFPQITPAELGPVQGFIVAQLGGYDAFQIVLPKISYTKAPSTPSGTPTVTTAAAAGAFTVTVNGLGANRTVLKAGDVFKFSNHTKVYIAINDLTSDGSGNGTLNFSGALVYPVTTSTTLTFDAVPFTVILNGDGEEFNIGYGGMTELSLDMREVWGS
jgi:hypothetical protein